MFELVSSTDVHSDSAPALRLLCTLLADVESARQQVGFVQKPDLHACNYFLVGVGAGEQEAPPSTQN
jgi:hypothetical protein